MTSNLSLCLRHCSPCKTPPSTSGFETCSRFDLLFHLCQPTEMLRTTSTSGAGPASTMASRSVSQKPAWSYLIRFLNNSKLVFSLYSLNLNLIFTEWTEGAIGEILRRPRYSKLASLPKVEGRELSMRENWKKDELLPRENYLLATMITAVGEPNDPPCKRCSNGTGNFLQCVSLENEMDGACNNHIWSKMGPQCEFSRAGQETTKRNLSNDMFEGGLPPVKRPKRNRHPMHGYTQVDPNL